MSLEVLDWRRQVFALYADVRRSPDPAAGHAIWVRGRNKLLSTHPASPVPPSQREAFAATVAPYDPELRFVTELDMTASPLRWTAGTTSDGQVPFTRLGTVHLPVGDLDVWWLESYGGGVFLPVHDPAPDTYGGGRYLLDTVKGADLGSRTAGSLSDRSVVVDLTLVVDLNFTYNPSCAYSPRWTCPLAPAGNRLPVPLTGGERTALA